MNNILTKNLHDLNMELYTYTTIIVERINNNNYDNSFDYAIEKTKLINSKIEIVKQIMEEENYE